MRSGDPFPERTPMTSDEHSQLFHLANDHVTAGRRNEALAIFAQLLESDLDDFGKSMACINMATIHDQLGQVAQALEAYDRGIAIERSFDRYNVALRKAAYCAEKERHGDALAALSALVASGISDIDKATACLTAATVCEKLGQTDKVLEWYDRGIRYERSHYRFAVAEHKAWYLSSKGRTKESLRIYDSLEREGSMTEADKDRIKNNISLLRK